MNIFESRVIDLLTNTNPKKLRKERPNSGFNKMEYLAKELEQFKKRKDIKTEMKTMKGNGSFRNLSDSHKKYVPEYDKKKLSKLKMKYYNINNI
jgi:hypothetical protein